MRCTGWRALPFGEDRELNRPDVGFVAAPADLPTELAEIVAAYGNPRHVVGDDRQRPGDP